jgi:hypothetical protein
LTVEERALVVLDLTTVRLVYVRYLHKPIVDIEFVLGVLLGSLEPLMRLLFFREIHNVAAVAAHDSVIVALAMLTDPDVIRRPAMWAGDEMAYRRIA